MRNILLLLLCLSALGITNAQEMASKNEDNLYYGKQEIKLNALLLIVGAIEVNYEYLLSEESGIGISAFLPYDEEIKDNIQYYVSPYYRYYFGNKYAAGFFLEGFGMLNSSERDLNFIFENEEDNFVTDFALGIGLGGKWVTKSGFIGEISFGIGRNLFNGDESDFDFVSKGGITIGYRF